MFIPSTRLPVAAAVFLASLTTLAPLSQAGPVTTTTTAPDQVFNAASAAAPLSGIRAVANTNLDVVEIYSQGTPLPRPLTLARLQALLPWMSFNTVADGPCSMTFTDSGRLLFIAVVDTSAAPDGLPGDAILRYDTYTDQLTLFHRMELGGFNTLPRPTLAHFKGRLYVTFGTTISVFNARMNDTAASFIFSTTYGASSTTTSLAIDRITSTLYVATGSVLSRAPISGNSLNFTTVGTLNHVSQTIRALAWSDHFGGPGQNGLYIAHTPVGSPDANTPMISFITPAMARGQQAIAPVVYLRGFSPLTGLHATADGALHASVSNSNTISVTDSTDTRLSYPSWRVDEFNQVVNFAKSLISPDGEPAGWVIDADVIPAWNRFHPATPDAAAWTVLLLLMSDELTNDPQSLPLVRSVLTRYAGLAPDGIAPSRNADGIFRHWINPLTGNAKPGWDPEYATLSTMKIIVAAARAKAYYPQDAQVQAAADAIICNTSNWDDYFDFSGRLYYKGLPAGGKDATSASSGWHEGVIFTEQAGVYGDTLGPLVADRWLNRSFWPTATLVTGRPVTTDRANAFGAAFISLYPSLLIDAYRQSPSWQTHVLNLRLSNAAWTDDNGPRHNTVFSAGTTRSDWGGYRADSLSDHPGDVATFTSLMSFASGGTNYEPDALAAYHAYRTGARQTFKGGASILYRRSNVDPGYVPDSAGLPDVALGALGLAELIMPGSVQSVLTGSYPSCDPLCPSDWNQDGGVDGSDVNAFFLSWEAGDADINEDGGSDGADVETFFVFFEAGC